MPSPKAVALVLSKAEREQLEAWARRRKSAQALAQRSRIVLAAAAGLTNTEIAQRFAITRGMAAKWRARFAAERLDGLVDEPRPGRPRTITDAQVEEVIVRTLETTPRDATHWSTRSLATELGLSQRAVVLCVDVKSQIQALDRTAPILPMLPGTPARATHDYKRFGTSSLYAALDIGSGKVIGSLHARHRAIEFKTFLQRLDREVPDELEVHLILDNASTHKTPAIRKWLLAHPRFVLHFTPTSSSWLNLVERWFAELTTKKLRRGTHRSVRELNTDIRDWIETWNDNPRPFVWTKTADEILDSIARYCTRINDSRH